MQDPTWWIGGVLLLDPQIWLDARFKLMQELRYLHTKFFQLNCKQWVHIGPHTCHLNTDNELPKLRYL